MNKQKVKEMIKFSLRKNIQNKWFVILNALIFIIILLALNSDNIGTFLEERNINLFDDELKILYIDNENLIGDSLEEAFKDYEKLEIEKITENTYDKDNIENNVIVEIFSDNEDILKAKIISKEGIDGGIYNEILNVLEEKRTEIFSRNNHIEKSALENLEKGVDVERLMLGVDSENSDKKSMIEYISTMIMYMVSIFIFSKIANDIAQEKVFKSIEYVLTSVSEKEYLFAKIVSIVLVVLLQGVYLIVYYLIGNLINNLLTDGFFAEAKLMTNSVFTTIDLELVKYILVVFVYGVLTITLMSIIQAALSSKTTSMQEAGNSMMFLLTITIGVYLLTFYLITPYTNMSWWIYVLSCVPLVSNFFIPAIIVIGQATMPQIIVSLIALIISIPVAFHVCSKIFKNGVLDYKQTKNKKHKVKKELSLIEEQNLKLDKVKFKRLGFVTGLAVILFVVLEILSNFLLQLFVLPALYNVMNEVAVDLIYEIIVSIIGLSVASLFVNLYIVKQEKHKKLDKKESRRLLIISILFIAVVQAIFTYIENLLGVEQDMSSIILDVQGLDNPLNAVLFFIEIAIIPGIFEELFFRKKLIDLSRNFGDKFSVVFSSLVFGIVHLNFSQAFFAFTIGLILGTLYVKTGSMKYNMLLHMINNGYAAIAAILLFNELNFAIFIYEMILLFVIIICTITFMETVIEKRKKHEKITWLDGELIPKNIKYILTDYTVIISTVFVVVLFMATEMILNHF